MIEVGDTVTVSIEFAGEAGGRLGGSFTLPTTTQTTGDDQPYDRGSGRTEHVWTIFERADYEQSGVTTW